jgi:glutamyl-tRNA reductase
MVALTHPGAVLGAGVLADLRAAGCQDGVVLAGPGHTAVYTLTGSDDPAGVLAVLEVAAQPHAGMAAQLLAGEPAVEHLFRSAAGLCPVGSSDVYERLRVAYRDAQAAGMASPDLNHLLHAALRCGFWVRGRVGISSSVINLTEERQTAGERLAHRMVAGAVARYLDGVATRDAAPRIPAPRAGEPVRAPVGA